MQLSSLADFELAPLLKLISQVLLFKGDYLLVLIYIFIPNYNSFILNIL